MCIITIQRKLLNTGLQKSSKIRPVKNQPVTWKEGELTFITCGPIGTSPLKSLGTKLSCNIPYIQDFHTS